MLIEKRGDRSQSILRILDTKCERKSVGGIVDQVIFPLRIKLTTYGNGTGAFYENSLVSPWRDKRCGRVLRNEVTKDLFASPRYYEIPRCASGHVGVTTSGFSDEKRLSRHRLVIEDRVEGILKYECLQAYPLVGFGRGITLTRKMRSCPVSYWTSVRSSMFPTGGYHYLFYCEVSRIEGNRIIYRERITLQFNSVSKKSVGEDLAIDFILYSCMEEEKKQRKLTQEGASFISWPNIKGMDQSELVDSLAEEYEEDLLEDMVSWYAANFEELTTSGPWDYGNIADVIPALVSLNNDIVRIIKAKSEDGKFPDLSAQGAATSKRWVRIKKLVDQYFSKKAHIIHQYLEWSHTPEADRAPLQPKALKIPQQNLPNGNLRRQGQSQAPLGGQSEGDSREFGRNRSQNRGKDRSNGHSKNRGNSQRPQQKNFNDRDQSGRRPGDPEREADAIRDCRDALTILRNDSSQVAITLLPQNSFYRRIQHNHVSENGFFSISVGEGRERAVQVHRTQPEGKTFVEEGITE